MRADGSGAGWSVSQAREQGEAALRAGKLGMILVAGGQGTRLGFDRPKGMFEIGPLSRRTLFEFHADRLAAVAKRYGVTIPLYIMTSPATHAETEAYLQAIIGLVGHATIYASSAKEQCRQSINHQDASYSMIMGRSR